MAVFTSSIEELNEADISRDKSAASTKVSFSGKLDSKGRITVPARIRNKLGLNSGDQLTLSITSQEVKRKQVSNFDEAKAFIEKFSNVRTFSFDDEVVEVVLSE